MLHHHFSGYPVVKEQTFRRVFGASCLIWIRCFAIKLNQRKIIEWLNGAGFE